MPTPLQPTYTAAIILNYNGAADTIDCLRSLYTLNTPPGLILVVDNHSTDNSCADIIQAWQQWAFPVVTSNSFHITTEHAIFLALPTNEGFSSGNNAGIQYALKNPTFQAIWILNNDTEVLSDALDNLCTCLNGHPKAGIAGSTLVYAHGHRTVQCAGGFNINKYFGTTTAVCGHNDLSAVLQTPVAEITPQIDYLCGASMLIKREVFDRIGLFREDYFLYYEDAEFCLRATNARFTLAWAPSSIVYHKEGGSTAAKSAVQDREFHRPAWVDYLSLRNRVYMMRKHYPWALPLVLLSYLGVMVNRIRRGQADRILLVCRAAWDGLRGHMGKPVHLFPTL